jgi:hypothetical protein
MKIILTVLVMVALGYSAYSTILAAGTYVEVSQIVDDAILALKPGMIEGMQQALSGDRSDPAPKLRDAILAKTAKAHLPIAASDIAISDTEQRLQVQVKWAQPVIVYQDQVVFAVPLSVKRAFGSERPAR